MDEVLRLVDVDLYNPKYIIINAKQYDNNSRKVIITCYSGGTPVNISHNKYAAFVRYKKPDDHNVFNDCRIVDGKIELILTEQMLMAEGRAYGEIVLIERSQLNDDFASSGNYEDYINEFNVEILSTMPFVVNVVASTFSNPDAESTDEYNAFYNLVARMLRDYIYILQETNYMATPVRKINGKYPDEDGNFTFVGEDWNPVIEEALRIAKESGMFDGKTPVKGVDYFTNADIIAAGIVKSVNGITPSANGNVTISMPELTIGQNSISGGSTGMIKNATITSYNLAAGAVYTGNLADRSVTSIKIAENGVERINIKDLAVNSAKLEGSAVTESKIAADAVTTSKIKKENVTSEKLALGAVTRDRIRDGAVSTAQLEKYAVSAPYSYNVQADGSSSGTTDGVADPNLILKASGWTVVSANGTYKQVITLSRQGAVTGAAEESIIFDVNANYNSNDPRVPMKQLEQWSYVMHMRANGANSIVAYAHTKPDIDLPISIIVLRR